MVKENGLLWEVTFWEFFFVTIVLAGSAAYLTGRAVTRSWTSGVQLAGYMILLTAACRFIHFALFNGTLLTLHYYIVDLIILLVIAFIGRQVTRAKQIAELVRKTGRPFHLDPMNSYDRRIIHNAFKDDPDIMTWSPQDDSKVKRITLKRRDGGAG